MSFLASKVKIKTTISIPPKHKYQSSKSIAKGSKIKFALFFISVCLSLNFIPLATLQEIYRFQILSLWSARLCKPLQESLNLSKIV